MQDWNFHFSSVILARVYFTPQMHNKISKVKQLLSLDAVVSERIKPTYPSGEEYPGKSETEWLYILNRQGFSDQ